MCVSITMSRNLELLLDLLYTVHSLLLFFFCRGPASDWFDVIHPYLSYSMRIRRWIAENVFLKNKHRFCEYLLECPSTEVRKALEEGREGGGGEREGGGGEMEEGGKGVEERGKGVGRRERREGRREGRGWRREGGREGRRERRVGGGREGGGGGGKEGGGGEWKRVERKGGKGVEEGGERRGKGGAGMEEEAQGKDSP